MNVILIIALFITYIFGGISASIIYHQTLSHKVIVLKPWFEKLMVVLALPAGTPVQWVGTHRQHHLFTDKDGDPHSPKLFGFWFAHCGWYISNKNTFICFLYSIAGIFRMFFDGYWRPRNRLEFNHLAKDISDVEFYRIISKPMNYMLILWLYAIVLCLIFYSIAGLIGFIFLWAILALIYNLGDAINSIAHIYGKKINNTNHAKNNYLLSLFTFGEGKHANHHANSQILSNAKLNIVYFILKTWKIFGLAKFQK